MILTIPENDHGSIRVFDVSDPLPDGLADKSPAAFLAAFGVDGLNPDFVDVVDLAALEDMTLTDFLIHGYDMTPDAVDRAGLDRLTGHVVLIMSRAFGDAATTLTLGSGIQHITTCGDAARLAIPEPMPSDSATGIIEDPVARRKSDAAMGGRVAMFALIVMFGVFGLMIWIGG